eukprot:1138382-Alexandrium_andersonii.AAC.1
MGQEQVLLEALTFAGLKPLLASAKHHQLGFAVGGACDDGNNVLPYLGAFDQAAGSKADSRMPSR